jgi:hypothetical protein
MFARVRPPLKHNLPARIACVISSERGPRTRVVGRGINVVAA